MKFYAECSFSGHRKAGGAKQRQKGEVHQAAIGLIPFKRSERNTSVILSAVRAVPPIGAHPQAQRTMRVSKVYKSKHQFRSPTPMRSHTVLHSYTTRKLHPYARLPSPSTSSLHSHCSSPIAPPTQFFLTTCESPVDPSATNASPSLHQRRVLVQPSSFVNRLRHKLPGCY